MISTVFFPRVTDQFQEQYNIPIQLLEYGSLRARTLVDNEQLDIAMANMDFYNLDKYNSYVMMEDRYVYCVSKTHRYAGEKEITMDMLKDEPLSYSIRTLFKPRQSSPVCAVPGSHQMSTCTAASSLLSLILSGVVNVVLFCIPLSLPIPVILL